VARASKAQNSVELMEGGSGGVPDDDTAGS
jgi:hypothetical protein